MGTFKETTVDSHSSINIVFSSSLYDFAPAIAKQLRHHKGLWLATRRLVCVCVCVCVRLCGFGGGVGGVWGVVGGRVGVGGGGGGGGISCLEAAEERAAAQPRSRK